MTDQELKERLAKFAGFGFYISPLSTSVLDLKTVWYYPVSGTNCHHLPDFPNDLNAIFKWLVPEVHEHFKKMEANNPHAYEWAKYEMDKLLIRWLHSMIWTGDSQILKDNPARALAKAIGRMIDNE